MQKRNFTIPDNGRDSESRLAELTRLSSDVIDLFYTQTIQPETIRTPADVCSAFSEILGRHWQLCSISIFCDLLKAHCNKARVTTAKDLISRRFLRFRTWLPRRSNQRIPKSSSGQRANSIAAEYDKARVAGKTGGCRCRGMCGSTDSREGGLSRPP